MPLSPHPLIAAAVTGLFVIAIAGSLVVDSLLSSLTYASALAGLAFIVMARLRGTRALPPADREIKLIGFALAFFALASLATWALNGFGYEDFKNLGKHGRLLLFWPLFVALAYGRLRERTALLGLAAIPLGWGLGWLLAVAVSQGLQSDLYRVPVVVERGTYAAATALFLSVAALSALAARRRIDSLDLIAVLKTRE